MASNLAMAVMTAMLLVSQAKAQDAVKRVIVVSLEDHKLALVEDGQVKMVYTVAVGKHGAVNPVGMNRIEHDVGSQSILRKTRIALNDQFCRVTPAASLAGMSWTDSTSAAVKGGFPSTSGSVPTSIRLALPPPADLSLFRELIGTPARISVRAISFAWSTDTFSPIQIAFVGRFAFAGLPMCDTTLNPPSFNAFMTTGPSTSFGK